MNGKSSHYQKEALPNEYLHTFHAGNVGDVWKHVVLLAVLERLICNTKKLRVLDCYAGAGGYRLRGTGEWTEGIGALLRSSPLDSPAVARYVEKIRPRFEANRFYPGSPLLIRSLLRPSDSLTCFEINSETRADLLRALSSDREVSGEDGLAALIHEAKKCAEENVEFFAFIDPPWVKKEDWQTIPRAIIEASQSAPRACQLLWYPIKSYTRVNAMVKSFQEAKLPAVVMDLITTPLESQRNRLNGSGLILVNPDAQVVSELAAAASWIGRACATKGSYWSLRLTELGI